MMLMEEEEEDTNGCKRNKNGSQGDSEQSEGIPMPLSFIGRG